MIHPIKQAVLSDFNAIYCGYPIEKLMERAGKGIAKILVKEFGRNKRIAFICGPGNNGGDGFVAARHLMKNSFPEVFLVGKIRDIRTREARKNWTAFSGPKFELAKASEIEDRFDIVVECLFGTGVHGKLREPFASVVVRLNRLKAKRVAIDIPAKGFRSDLSICLMTEKEPGARIVDIGFPASIASKVGVGEVKVLHKPGVGSHKGDNGIVLIVGGSKEFHGAPLLAATVASKAADLIFFSSTEDNNKLLKKMRSRLSEFIAVDRSLIDDFAKKSDVILIGPGLGIDGESRSTTNGLLEKYFKKIFVLDADALKVVKKKNLGPNTILTPHHGEFKQLFGCAANRENATKMAKKYKCIIILKGKTDYICAPDKWKKNEAGNPGLTKGGTGDVLAGLVAALAAVNDPFLAATAGTFIVGLAADRLQGRVSHYFSASDLIKEIPGTIKWCEDFKI